jgi:hypothetical protein
MKENDGVDCVELEELGGAAGWSGGLSCTHHILLIIPMMILWQNLAKSMHSIQME